ncbi:hypothetical protein AMECASPLE_000632 [Ameca splendens]|uniref:Uncharacterized protein n=1 Tax=Ameca splendens TaxID=208324 RepID=A0ABV0ZHH6_9TELE
MRSSYCGGRTNQSVDLLLHSPITCEQDTKILELLHLREELPMASDLEELILISAASHSALNRPSACCWSWLEGASRTMSSAQKERQNPLVPQPDLLWPLTVPRNPVYSVSCPRRSTSHPNPIGLLQLHSIPYCQ